MAKALGITFLLIAGIAAFMVYRTGALKDVPISSQTMGPLYLAYLPHEGPYHRIVPVIESVENKMKALGIECQTAFGRYIDNPDEVDHDRLKSHGGCLSQNPNEFSNLATDKDLVFDKVESKEYVIATFNGSPSIGPMVVYPKVKEWFKKYGYKINAPVIEVYKTQEDGSVLTKYLFSYE